MVGNEGKGKGKEKEIVEESDIDLERMLVEDYSDEEWSYGRGE